MQQLSLISKPLTAPLPASIDLRCASIDVILRELQGADEADRPWLVFADPPWPKYDNQPGSADPELQYALLDLPQIREHLRRAALVSRPKARLMLWVVWIMLVEWAEKKTMRQVVPPAWSAKSAGAWLKQSASPGVGYHWQGATEPAIVLVRSGKGSVYTQTDAMVDNGWASEREQHSRKPAEWQARCIQRWVPEGGLVLDLYAGLGSVAEAVILAGGDRRYIGAEINPKRCEEARALVHHNVVNRKL